MVDRGFRLPPGYASVVKTGFEIAAGDPPDSSRPSSTGRARPLPPADRPLFRYDPIGESTGWRKLVNSLVLHLSIGEAF